jgi:hypothetical protein
MCASLALKGIVYGSNSRRLSEGIYDLGRSGSSLAG